MITYKGETEMKTFWDKIACLYDLAEFTNKSVNDQMAKAVENEIPQGALVLDCAAGTGALSMAAAKRQSTSPAPICQRKCSSNL